MQCIPAGLLQYYSLLKSSQDPKDLKKGAKRPKKRNQNPFIRLNFIEKERRLLHLHYQLLTLLQSRVLDTVIHLVGEPARAGF